MRAARAFRIPPRQRRPRPVSRPAPLAGDGRPGQVCRRCRAGRDIDRQSAEAVRSCRRSERARQEHTAGNDRSGVVRYTHATTTPLLASFHLTTRSESPSSTDDSAGNATCRASARTWEALTRSADTEPATSLRQPSPAPNHVSSELGTPGSTRDRTAPDAEPAHHHARRPSPDKARTSDRAHRPDLRQVREPLSGSVRRRGNRRTRDTPSRPSWPSRSTAETSSHQPRVELRHPIALQPCRRRSHPG